MQGKKGLPHVWGPSRDEGLSQQGAATRPKALQPLQWSRSQLSRGASVHLHPISDLVDSGGDIIIGGDTNGYSHLWGIYSANTLSRNSTAWRFGRETEELITSSGLICFNDTDNIIPTYHHAASNADYLRSTIDATFGTIDLHVTNWRVLDEYPYQGDHSPILFTVSLTCRSSDNNGHNHALSDLIHSRTNWELFEANLGRQKCAYYTAEALQPSADVDELERRITAVLQEAARASTPARTRRGTTPPPNSWWDQELRSRRATLSKVKRQYGCQSDAYKEERKGYRELIKEKKDASFRLFASSLEGSNTSFLSRTTRDASSLPTTLNDFPTVEGTTSALADRYLGDPFDEASLNHRTEHISDDTRHLSDAHNDFPLSLMRREIIKRCKATSPGSCGIRWEHLLHSPDWVLSEIARLYQISFDMAVLPKHWLHSTVVYIPKATGHGTVKGVRPITLSCTLCKLQEALLVRRLNAITEVIAHRGEHFAYLPRRSAISLVDEILRYVQQGPSGQFVKRKPPWAIAALDLSNAFGSVPHDQLLRALARLKVPSKETEWLKAWLGPRLNSNHHLGIHTTRRARDGVGLAQGSVLSPLLFVYFMDLVTQTISANLPAHPFRVRFFCYADDCYIAFKFGPRSSLPSRDEGIRHMIDELVPTLADFNLTLSTEKTEILTSYGSAVYARRCIKILGITITNRLNFAYHLKARLAKCHNVTMKAMRYAKKAFGIPPSGIIHLAKAVWVPTLSYGLEIWGVSLIGKNTCDLIDSAFRRIIKLAYRLPPSTPNAFVDIMSGAPRLSYLLTDKFLTKALHKTEHGPAADARLTTVIQASRGNPRKML
ncbi:hypothetical protein FOZ62_028297 [Perkinsus olseni]|uniref:Reverse transcriptase domain-containing protein n=1 Tax=Perkinsus olseni TaxID=32597 RepID=A0A7J6QJR9_PEROL|nr:hypothetical protein FOZ62_028297 [Perkinsus olseni]